MNVFRNRPIESIHKQASRQREAAECAAISEILGNARAGRRESGKLDAGPTSGLTRARSVLSTTAFEQCLTSAESQSKVRSDVADGRAVLVFVFSSLLSRLLQCPNPAYRKRQSTVRRAPSYAIFKKILTVADFSR